MQIIILRITSDTTKSELKKVVQLAIDKSFRLPFSSPPRINSVEILRITDPKGNLERHGIVALSSDRSSKRIIGLLNRSRVNGKRVLARRFQKRQPSTATFEPAAERRRSNLDMQMETYPICVSLGSRGAGASI